MSSGQMTSSQVRGAQRLATLLAATPGLRAKFFANPTKLGRQLPARKYWDYGIDPGLFPWHPMEFFRQRHYKRARLARQTLELIAARIDEGKLSSSVNTDAVFEDFFRPIVRVSQRTFNAIFVLSVLAFFVGSGLIGAGIYIAIYPPPEGNSTILGSVFGGTGAVSALGAVYTMATQGIAKASTSHVTLRIVLTAFATQLGQLRAIAEETPGPGKDPLPPDKTKKKLAVAWAVNQAIEDAMSEAVKKISESEALKKISESEAVTKIPENVPDDQAPDQG
jgi:hypothetical protein